MMRFDGPLAEEILQVTQYFRGRYSDGHTVASMVETYGRCRAAQIANPTPPDYTYGKPGSGGKG
jgi:hypothetical protein